MDTRMNRPVADPGIGGPGGRPSPGAIKFFSDHISQVTSINQLAAQAEF